MPLFRKVLYYDKKKPKKLQPNTNKYNVNGLNVCDLLLTYLSSANRDVCKLLGGLGWVKT